MMEAQGVTGNDDYEVLEQAIVESLTTSIPEVSSKDTIIVNDLPRFDLDQYISNYTGHMGIQRLICIGNHCPPLAPEAFRTVIHLLKKTLDVTTYRVAVNGLANVAPNDANAVLDEEWIEQTSKTVRLKTEKLEAELKSYKNNMIKESIRAGHEDLGHHYYEAGDLPSAFKAYSRMRDYCTTPKHMLDMSLNLVLISIEQSNYVSVTTNIAKIGNYLRSDDEVTVHQPKMSAATGLAQMARNSYLEAARSFLSTPVTLGTTYTDVLTMNDVAVYGGLCALASMDRDTLKTEVLENVSFRNFLELEPHIRRAVTAFYAARYGECLSILENYKNDYLLDIFLRKHVQTIYERIRTKGIVQYFLPFNCVTLERMAKAFDTDENSMENELIKLIEKGELSARIDTQNRLVTSKETQFRYTVHKNTLEMAEEYERTARQRLMRMNIVRAGLDIKGFKQANSGQGLGRKELRHLMQ